MAAHVMILSLPVATEWDYMQLYSKCNISAHWRDVHSSKAHPRCHHDAESFYVTLPLSSASQRLIRYGWPVWRMGWGSSSSDSLLTPQWQSWSPHKFTRYVIIYPGSSSLPPNDIREATAHAEWATGSWHSATSMYSGSSSPPSHSTTKVIMVYLWHWNQSHSDNNISLLEVCALSLKLFHDFIWVPCIICRFENSLLHNPASFCWHSRPLCVTHIHF